jgi:hypothetical protein
LARLTIGLDPASPSFKNADPSTRLDRTDGIILNFSFLTKLIDQYLHFFIAHFVDVIHTDADGMIIKENGIVRIFFFFES